MLFIQGQKEYAYVAERNVTPIVCGDQLNKMLTIDFLLHPRADKAPDECGTEESAKQRNHHQQDDR